MDKPFIAGIQQIGIGVSKVYEAWKWYRLTFGMNIPMFDEAATANLMLPYTNNTPQNRHAVLALNMGGGGAIEIWQYTSRQAQAANFDIQVGDYGIYCCKIKCKNVVNFYNKCKTQKQAIVGKINFDPTNMPYFFMHDPYGNLFQIIQADNFFGQTKSYTGGVYGSIIGVSNIDKARHLYSDILGYDTVLYDETKTFSDLHPLPGGHLNFRRVLLSHSKNRQGAFSHMLGSTQIELLQVQNRQAQKIYKNRLWGDLGFIHLCFDIWGMKDLRKLCKDKGFPFTVDSSDALNGRFNMGKAAGHFAYIEDPDGTLIEFVETHKIPILKKLNWYLDLNKRNAAKPLPNYILKTLALNSIKN
jgi:catechol 2,3-dioxygenase-like lactoylglutathione lyase family enzyme